MTPLKCFFMSAAFFLTASHAHCQLSDTAFVSAGINNAKLAYQNLIGTQAQLYNGSAYVEPRTTGESHPYFQTQEWQQGSVVIEQERFDNVDLIFDAYSQKLIAETSQGNLMALNSEKVNSFVIGIREFVKLDNRDFSNTLPQSGFYELLYDGKTKLVAFRKKDRQESIASQELTITYELKDKYFLLKDGKFYPVKGKKSILNVLAEQKHSLRSAINKNKIPFKSNREYALASVAEIYDSLISQ